MVHVGSQAGLANISRRSLLSYCLAATGSTALTPATPAPVRPSRSAREQAPCRLAEPRLAEGSVNEARQGLHQAGGSGRLAQLLAD